MAGRRAARTPAAPPRSEPGAPPLAFMFSAFPPPPAGESQILEADGPPPPPAPPPRAAPSPPSAPPTAPAHSRARAPSHSDTGTPQAKTQRHVHKQTHVCKYARDTQGTLHRRIQQTQTHMLKHMCFQHQRGKVTKAETEATLAMPPGALRRQLGGVGLGAVKCEGGGEPSHQSGNPKGRRCLQPPSPVSCALNCRVLQWTGTGTRREQGNPCAHGRWERATGKNGLPSKDSKPQMPGYRSPGGKSESSRTGPEAPALSKVANGIIRVYAFWPR